MEPPPGWRRLRPSTHRPDWRSKPYAKEPNVRVEPGTILAVDDDRLSRMMLTRCLTQAGHTVVTADNGRQGLALLQAQAFDVVLLDVQMPEMDGFAVLEHIMRDRTLRHIPVIMVSGLDEIASVVACIEVG